MHPRPPHLGTEGVNASDAASMTPCTDSTEPFSPLASDWNVLFGWAKAEDDSNRASIHPLHKTKYLEIFDASKTIHSSHDALGK